MSMFYINLSNMGLTKSVGELFVRTWRVGKDYYGINASGVYKLAGNTDNGYEFSSVVKISNNHYGDDHLKRLTEIEVDKEGEMESALIYDDVAVCNGVDVKHNGLIKFSKGGGGNTVSVLFHSTDEKFILRGIKLSPVVIGKGAL